MISIAQKTHSKQAQLETIKQQPQKRNAKKLSNFTKRLLKKQETNLSTKQAQRRAAGRSRHKNAKNGFLLFP